MVLPSNVVDYLQVKDEVICNEIRTDILRDKDDSGAVITANSSLDFANGKGLLFPTAGTGGYIGTGPTQKIGFFGATPVVQQAGVAVSAAGIHAALVTLGLITA